MTPRSEWTDYFFYQIFSQRKRLLSITQPSQISIVGMSFAETLLWNRKIADFSRFFLDFFSFFLDFSRLFSIFLSLQGSLRHSRARSHPCRFPTWTRSTVSQWKTTSSLVPRLTRTLKRTGQARNAQVYGVSYSWGTCFVPWRRFLSGGRGWRKIAHV